MDTYINTMTNYYDCIVAIQWGIYRIVLWHNENKMAMNFHLTSKFGKVFSTNNAQNLGRVVLISK